MSIGNDTSMSLPGPIRFVKLYGERHSGTKELEDKLVRPRLRIQASWLQDTWQVGEKVPGREALPKSADEYFQLTFQANFGWKHGEPPTPQQLEAGGNADTPSCNNTIFLVTTRHPLDWVASLYKQTYVIGWKPYNPGGRSHQRLRDFVRAPAPCVPRANRDGLLTGTRFTLKPWDNPIRYVTLPLTRTARPPRAILLAAAPPRVRHAPQDVDGQGRGVRGPCAASRLLRPRPPLFRARRQWAERGVRAGTRAALPAQRGPRVGPGLRRGQGSA